MKAFDEARKEIQYWLDKKRANELIIPTIGGNRNLRVALEDNTIVFYNNPGTRFIIDQMKWDAVYQRRESLPNHLRNQNYQYGNPGWVGMPSFLNYIIAPYIPAIMKYLEENPTTTIPGDILTGIKTKVIILIKEDYLDQAIELLRDYTFSNSQEAITGKLVVLSGNLSEIRRAEQLNTWTQETILVERSKIRKSLVEILETVH